MSRILLTTYEFAPFRGGIGRVAENLAEGAVACGLDPVVLAPDYGGDHRAADAGRRYPVRRFDGAFCSLVSPRRLIRFAGVCRRAIREVEPDVVHGVDPQSQMALTALSRLARLDGHILTVYGTELLRYRAEILPRLWMRGGFRRAGRVCAISRHVHELLHREFDVDPGRTFVSHPPIAPAWHETPPADRSAVRATHGIDGDAFVVLTVARVVATKGHDRVLEGLTRLPPRLRSRLTYVVAGAGPEDYARRLDEAAVAGDVRLVRTGPLSDPELLALYDGADLFVMLSRRTPRRLEGLGLTYVEAGARGVPSIACDTGGVAEAVLDGRTGILLPADADAEAVAAAVERLVEDGGLRERLGAGAREHAAFFTCERHARDVYGRAGLVPG